MGCRDNRCRSAQGVRLVAAQGRFHRITASVLDWLMSELAKAEVVQVVRGTGTSAKTVIPPAGSLCQSSLRAAKPSAHVIGPNGRVNTLLARETHLPR